MNAGAGLCIVGALMIVASVILWHIGEGLAALAIMFALCLFGGLAIVAGIVVLALRARVR